MDDPEMRIVSGDAFRPTLLIAGAAASLLVLGACGESTLTVQPIPPTQASATEASPSQSLEPSPSQTGTWPAQELLLSGNPDLQALAAYGDVLQHKLPDEYMTFTGMPRTPEQAEADATAMAETLKKFQAAGVKPLVIMEPQSYDDGTILDLDNIAQGGSDALMTTYYQELKSQGITDEMMGEWVVLPEANTPAWNNTDPETVRNGIIHLAQTQKAVFPGSRVSVMFDSESYASDDTEYANGQYNSLVPYVHNMPAGLINSFGLEGFPWVDAGAPPSDVDSPAQFLSAQMATEAAKALGVRDIWFNTGTFASMHDDDPTGRVVMSAAQRQELLQQIGAQVIEARAAGYDVTLNIFGADKSKLDEATDWSYKSASDARVLAKFIATMRTDDVDLSLFDSRTP